VVGTKGYVAYVPPYHPSHAAEIEYRYYRPYVLRPRAGRAHAWTTSLLVMVHSMEVLMQ